MHPSEAKRLLSPVQVDGASPWQMVSPLLSPRQRAIVDSAPNTSLVRILLWAKSGFLLLVIFGCLSSDGC